MVTTKGSPARVRAGKRDVGACLLVPAMAALALSSGCDATAKRAPANEATATVPTLQGQLAASSAPVALNKQAGQDGLSGNGPIPGTMGHAGGWPAAAKSRAFGTGTAGGLAVGASPAPAATYAAPAEARQALDLVGGRELPRIAAPVPRLDPNARYATTYRPGGAALAAFTAAVDRGQIPASYRDIVGDFGNRYATPLDPPHAGALAIAAQTERAAVGPGGGPMNLLVSLASNAANPQRAPLSVHIVLDISGSMSGQAISDAKHAAEAAVEKLEPTDDFSMVTFSSDARVLVADGPIGPRRAQVLARIEGVQAEGGTNISAGLDLGYAQARAAGGGDDAVRLVMLLSDGHANAGDTDIENLAARAARAFQNGVQTSSFGLGPDYDAVLMSHVADRGAGGYYYLADSSQIAPALAREMDARLRPVATAVELRVRLRPDVSASHVFGSRELSAYEADLVRAQEVAVDRHEAQKGIAADRQVDAAGGMRFFIPAFAPADRHATMITLQLPPGAGERRVASVEIRYKDRLLNKNVTQELPVSVAWAATDAESASTARPDVERVEQAFAAGETILQAADDVDRGLRPQARQELLERADVLRSAAAALGEPRFQDDAARLTRLGDAVGGAQPIADALPLVVMLRGSGYGYL
jgi:Ca-activated chloride channel family protein